MCYTTLFCLRLCVDSKQKFICSYEPLVDLFQRFLNLVPRLNLIFILPILLQNRIQQKINFQNSLDAPPARPGQASCWPVNPAVSVTRGRSSTTKRPGRSSTRSRPAAPCSPTPTSSPSSSSAPSSCSTCSSLSSWTTSTT